MSYYKDDKLVIRSMEAPDIEIFPKLFAEQGWHKTREQFQSYYNEQVNGNRKVIVAIYKGGLAGYTTFKQYATDGAFTGKNIPEISDFNVLIPYQRKGIGSKILDVAEELASEISSCVCLGVGLHCGYGTAQRMYIKRGYIPDGTGVWYNNKQLEQYADCKNDDDLVLYFSKELNTTKM